MRQGGHHVPRRPRSPLFPAKSARAMDLSSVSVESKSKSNGLFWAKIAATSVSRSAQDVLALARNAA